MRTIKGKVKVKFEEIQITEKFKKQELVIETDGQYPQLILVQFTQDNCDLLHGINVGDSVEVSYNLRGREWTNPQGEVKYFNSIEGWRVDKLQGVAPTQESAPVSNEDEDDLPF